jgi:hypothetical protein
MNTAPPPPFTHEHPAKLQSANNKLILVLKSMAPPLLLVVQYTKALSVTLTSGTDAEPSSTRNAPPYCVVEMFQKEHDAARNCDTNQDIRIAPPIPLLSFPHATKMLCVRDTVVILLQ